MDSSFQSLGVLTGDPLIQVEGLEYTDSGQRLLSASDLRISSGGPTVVMGPNGAGKSLLLRLLHGLLLPTKGNVRIVGANRKRLAMVFQRPVLLRRSVASNVLFAMPKSSATSQTKHDRLLDLLRMANLAEKSGQMARSLSGGEQQLLALIRALATEPDILFLDEPSANLDPGVTALLESLIAASAGQGIKVVLVTHDIGQARRLAEDVVFCCRGEIIEHQNAQTFFSSPLTDESRKFLQGELVI